MRPWITLNAAPGVGPRRFHQILKAFGSPEKALGSSAQDLGAKVPALGADGAAALLKFAESFDAPGDLDAAARLGARILNFRDPEYPACLLSLYDAPPVLYVQGVLPGESTRRLGVVGTRKPTEYGIAQCRSLIRGMAASKLAVISGLARGIDTAAHQCAIECGMPTVAVLGSGLACVYPAENAPLARRITECGGAVVSQFPMKSTPDRWRFPMRNGLLSGLSHGVLVVEGEEDSGSLITAEWALEQGREIFAVPGRVDSLQSRGPMRLIQQGAKLVMDAADILAEFPESAASAAKMKKSRAHPSEPMLPGVPRPIEDLTGEEALIVTALREQGRTAIEGLGGKLGMPAPVLSANLTMLEIKGAIRQLPGALVEAL